MLELLPVELVVEIMSELAYFTFDLSSLITLCYLSRRLHDIAADPLLNPWRKPILRNLGLGHYEECLKHLSVRTIVPRTNWIEILSAATPDFILFHATLPNLRSEEWRECCARRFLPGWQKWKRLDGSWKELFIKMLHRVWHRATSSCTTDEAWTKYIVLNRNGSANELEASSRHFSPLALFNEMKLQSNLAHLETRVRLVVQLADVRILALGTLNKPKSTLTINTNAHIFLHPPGITVDDNKAVAQTSRIVSDHGVYPINSESPGYPVTFPLSRDAYSRLTHPLPALSHTSYPWYTKGGGDKRWVVSEDLEEEGLQWVGGLLIIAQILGPKTHELSGDWTPLQDLDLVVGVGRQQYASFTWPDLHAIAPWLDERLTKKIDGPGLGI
ncbi:hypothetical protein C8J56DRAFT_1089809 [Mycena floridula]|nr:hypothetical protein C8J56DRAFT_1089809 [Mycena floridula]